MKLSSDSADVINGKEMLDLSADEEMPEDWQLDIKDILTVLVISSVSFSLVLLSCVLCRNSKKMRPSEHSEDADDYSEVYVDVENVNTEDFVDIQILQAIMNNAYKKRMSKSLSDSRDTNNTNEQSGDDVFIVENKLTEEENSAVAGKDIVSNRDCAVDKGTCDIMTENDQTLKDSLDKDKAACDMDMTVCHKDKDACDTDMTVCHKNKAACDTDMIVCHKDKAACDSDMTVCHKDKAACDEEKDACVEEEDMVYVGMNRLWPNLDEEQLTTEERRRSLTGSEAQEEENSLSDEDYVIPQLEGEGINIINTLLNDCVPEASSSMTESKRARVHQSLQTEQSLVCANDMPEEMIAEKERESDGKGYQKLLEELSATGHEEGSNDSGQSDDEAETEEEKVHKRKKLYQSLILNSSRKLTEVKEKESIFSNKESKFDTDVKQYQNISLSTSLPNDMIIDEGNEIIQDTITENIQKPSLRYENVSIPPSEGVRVSLEGGENSTRDVSANESSLTTEVLSNESETEQPIYENMSSPSAKKRNRKRNVYENVTVI